jgi:hypothetical protein
VGGKAEAYAGTETAVAGHDLDIGQWLRCHGIFDSAAMTISVIDFEPILGLFSLVRWLWWLIRRLEVCTFKAFNFKSV